MCNLGVAITFKSSRLTVAQNVLYELNFFILRHQVKNDRKNSTHYTDL